VAVAHSKDADLFATDVCRGHQSAIWVQCQGTQTLLVVPYLDFIPALGELSDNELALKNTWVCYRRFFLLICNEGDDSGGIWRCLDIV